MEEARRCQICDYGWFTKRVAKPVKTYGAGAGWALLGSPGMAAGAGAKAGAHYTTKLQRHDRWRQCPRCGSRKVRTVYRPGFVPTAAQESAGGQSVWPTPPGAPPQTAPLVPPRTATAPTPLGPPGLPPEPALAGHVNPQPLKAKPSPWPRRFKIAGLALLCFVLGPVSLVYGAEAVRRTGFGAGELVDYPQGRRPLLVATAGVLGTLGLVGMLVEQVALSLGAAATPAGELGGYGLIGIVLGSLTCVALVVIARRGHFSRLHLPAVLRVL